MTNDSSDEAPQRFDADDRHRAIIAALDSEGRVEVTELAARLGASEETIRRDLRRLEQDSLLIRAHGGAVRPQPMLLPGSERGEHALLERIAAEIPREGAIYLDGTPLAEHLVSLLPENGSIDLVTPLLDVAIAASTHPGVRVLSLGGQVDADGAHSGQWAREMLEALRLDTTVILAETCSEAGELTARPADAALRTLALRRARRAVLGLSAADPSPAQFAVYARLSDFDMVIADRGAMHSHAAALGTVSAVIVEGRA